MPGNIGREALTGVPPASIPGVILLLQEPAAAFTGNQRWEITPDNRHLGKWPPLAAEPAGKSDFTLITRQPFVRGYVILNEVPFAVPLYRHQ